MDALSKIAAMIMAAVLLTLFPLQYLLGHQLLLIYDYVENTTVQFNNEIREKGYIDADMYESFLKDLSTTGLRYNIEIEHAVPKESVDTATVVDLSDVTVETEISNNFTSLPDYLGAPPKQDENPDTIKTLAAHTHTDDCYAGTLHACDGVSCEYAADSGIAVAVARSGFYYTMDGYAWTLGTASYPFYVKDVTYGNGIFVAVGEGYIWYSTDGKNWTAAAYKGYNLENVSYGGGIFVATGIDTSGHAVLCTSIAGTSFNLSRSGADTSYRYVDVAYAGGYFLVVTNKNQFWYFTTDGKGLSDNNTYTPFSSYPSSVYSANGQFFFQIGSAMYMSYSPSVMYTFKNIGSINSGTTATVTYGNGKYVAVNSTGAYAISSDASTVIKVSDMNINYPRSTIFFKDKFLTTGLGLNGSALNPTYIDASTDGVTWTAAGFPQGVYGLACNSDGGSGVPVKRDTEVVVASSVYKQWTNIYGGTGWKYYYYLYSTKDGGATWSTKEVEAQPQYLTFGNNKFIFSDYYNNKCRIRVYDPVTQALNTLFTDSYNGNLFSCNKMLFRTISNSIYYSWDGALFSYANTVSGADNIKNIVYGNGVYVASADYNYYGSKKVAMLYSTDGIKWYNSTADIGGEEGDLVYADGRFIMYTAGGTGYVSTNGQSWSRISASSSSCVSGGIIDLAYGNGILIAFNQYDAYRSSDFGLTWTWTYQNMYNTLQSANFCDGTFYIGSVNNGGSTHPVLVKSTDAVNWVLVSIPVSSGEYLYSIAVNVDGGSGKYDRGPCLKAGKYYDASGNEVQPICDRVVTSIAATNPNQTVDKGGAIVTTATATYLDGHTGTVNCTSNFNSNQAGTQTITLTYSGLVGNAKTTGIRTCIVNVTVKETNIPSSLTVTPSADTVYNGIEPTYTVIVTYTSGASKTLSAGQYTKAGWTAGAGIKTVTFSYTENGRTVTKSLTVTVKPNLSSITVLPAAQSVTRYNNPSFTATAVYENNSFAAVTGYTVSGFNQNTIGDQNVTVSYTENGITKSVSVKVTVTPMTRICPICGTLYSLDGNDFDPGCPVCGTTVAYIRVAPEYIEVQKNASLPVTVTATYMDGHTAAVTGWTSNYNPGQTGLQLVTAAYQDRSAQVWVNVLSTKKCPVCGTEYILGNDGTDPGCPVCKSAVVSISASPASQNVNQGDELHLTVTALYRDGHLADVTGWESDFNPNKPGTQLVTVFYHNKSCTVNVTVISEFMTTCSICGYTYNFREYPFGCPICANFLVSISAVLKNGGTRAPFGKPLDLAVVLTYRDGHKLQAFNGWTDNFDPYTLGPQTVIVRYTDIYGNTVSCTLAVEVVNQGEAVICENGHLYYPDETGGVCPYCAMMSGKETEGLYNCTFTDEILDTLYTDGIYRFCPGDYVTIKVTIDIKGSIYSFGLFGRKEDRKEISYGGEVA